MMRGFGVVGGKCRWVERFEGVGWFERWGGVALDESWTV